MDGRELPRYELLPLCPTHRRQRGAALGAFSLVKTPRNWFWVQQLEKDFEGGEAGGDLGGLGHARAAPSGASIMEHQQQRKEAVAAAHFLRRRSGVSAGLISWRK
jgi:hypothetical protein